jgi:tetratricopeptide (TPR) repeat protein
MLFRHVTMNYAFYGRRRIDVCPNPPAEDPMKDFFISYNKADRAWAEWIAWELEADGYEVVIQAWDFRPGSNFVVEMDEGLMAAERMIAVLSPDYLSSSFTAPEWAAEFAKDAKGKDRRLVPVQVRETDLSGLLKQIVYVDFVGVHDEAAVRKLLLEAVQLGRAKPTKKPAFPGAPARKVPAQPRFPGGMPPIWNIPHNRNRNFTGRSDLLSRLRAQLQAERYSALTALHGLGGIGKTQTAVEYAYRFAAEYQLVWWIRAEDPSTLAGDFALLAAKLGVAEVEADQQVAIQAVKDHLAGTSAWLLVFDNASEPEEIRPYMPAGGGHVIITSRRPDWRSVADPLAVATMSVEDAVEFLHRRSGRKDELASRKLVEELGFLPLAIEQAAAYIDEHGRSIADYLDLFRKHRRQILKRGRPSLDYPDTVETTWEISIAKVREQSSPGADLLNLCAFLAPDDIPLDIIREAKEILPEPLTTAAGDALVWDEAVTALRRHSLVERTDEALSLHRLVQAVVRDRMTESDRQLWAELAARIVRKAFPYDSDDVTTWPVCVRLLAHATTAAAHCEAEGVGGVYAAGLLSQSALYLGARADYSGALDLNERALKIFEATFGPDDPHVAISLNNLGNTLRDLGNSAEAQKLFKRALQLHEAVHGHSHPKVAIDLNNLGNTLRDLGNLAEARKLYERSLQIDEKAYGPDHPIVAISLNNLGSLLHKLGELAEARTLLERALQIDEEAYGPIHPEVATDLSNLGILLKDLNDLPAAQKLLERALQIAESAYGSDHPAVANRLNNLGCVLRDLGDSEEARRLFTRALTILIAFIGPEHPDTAIVRNNLSKLDERP